MTIRLVQAADGSVVEEAVGLVPPCGTGWRLHETSPHHPAYNVWRRSVPPWKAATNTPGTT